MGGVESLCKSLKSVDTSRIAKHDVYRRLERTLRILLSLQPLRGQSRPMNSAVTEAISIISEHLGEADATDNEHARLLDMVEKLQAK